MNRCCEPFANFSDLGEKSRHCEYRGSSVSLTGVKQTKRAWTARVLTPQIWGPGAWATLLGVALSGSVLNAGAQQKPPADRDDQDEPSEQEPPELPPNLPALEVRIDKSKVDLDRRRLEVRMNQPADRVELKLYDESGFMLSEESHNFKGRRAGSALTVYWKKTSAKVGRIEVFAFDKWERFQGIAIVPWSFSVPHEEVVFENNSALIRPSEEPKLNKSLLVIQDAIERYKDLGDISLFIAGHTDTLGQPHHNKQLSRERAEAIALWFLDHGLSLPIFYEGFGESSLKVKTPDETAEPQNRRVDYVLSVDTPSYKTRGGNPAWRKL